MSLEKPFRTVEPNRESSPERFLTLLARISGMNSPEQLDTDQVYRLYDKKTLGGIIGMIIVGSSTDLNSSPKDVDVLFVSKVKPNSKSTNLINHLQTAFDLELSRLTRRVEMGRLDNLGQLILEDDSVEFSDLLPIHRSVILDTPKKPLVYAIDKLNGEKIERVVSLILNSE